MEINWELLQAEKFFNANFHLSLCFEIKLVWLITTSHLFLSNTKMSTLSTLCITGKLDCWGPVVNETVNQSRGWVASWWVKITRWRTGSRNVKLSMKERIHSISFESIGKRLTSKSCLKSVWNQCEWSWLAHFDGHPGGNFK